jgi:tetratricopeptide (TPR) repeat protein
MSKRSLVDEARDQAYWKQLNPDLHICEKKLLGTEQLAFDLDAIDAVKEELRIDGYFRLDKILDASLMESLAQGVTNVWKSGWPTAFAVMYDEYWEIFYSLRNLFSNVLGPNYKQLPNFWCWYIEANRKGKGWGCHRDRPSKNSMKPDGSLDTLTVWIPLTNATVENGCIYVLPINYDRNFPDHLEVSTIADPQSIRALPAERGSVLGWTESILHWGSRSSPRADAPRVSISFSFQRDLADPYETPLFATDVLPTWEERLGLVAQNVVKYHGHDRIDSKIVEACETLSNLIDPIQVEDGFKHEIYDKDKSLSELILWNIYEQRKEELAFYPTNNAYFCELYADLIMSFILDCTEQLDFNAPLYILQLNGDNGCFAYRFLSELLERKEHFDRLKKLKIRYVLSDSREEIVQECSQSPKLKLLIESGALDFAVFQPEGDSAIKLRESGDTISKETLRNPLIAVSNRFFDSSKHDSFRVVNGSLKEVRYTTYRDSRECDLSSPVALPQLRLIERYFDCPADRYSDKKLDDILEFYRQHFEEASVIMPIGAFRIISNLLRLSNNNLALFAVDRGFTSLNSNQIKGLFEQKHDAANRPSFNVNFDAIGRYFQAAGGTVFLEGNSQERFCTSANFLLKDKETKLIRFNHCFQERLINKDLANSLSDIESLLHKVSWDDIQDRTKLTMFLSVLQTYNFEPEVFTVAFSKLYEAVVEELPAIDDQQRHEILIALRRVWKNIYILDERAIMIDGIFRFYVALRAFDECLLLCQKALETYGALSTVIDHIAVCYEGLGQFDLAYKYFHQSVEQVPDHEWAREGLERTKKRLATDKVAEVSTPPA